MTCELVVGTNHPMATLVADRGRRYPTTVHAVDAEAEDEPFKALCGNFVIYRYNEDPWPPGIPEDWCPRCVRLSEKGWRNG